MDRRRTGCDAETTPNLGSRRNTKVIISVATNSKLGWNCECRAICQARCGAPAAETPTPAPNDVRVMCILEAPTRAPCRPSRRRRGDHRDTLHRGGRTSSERSGSSSSGSNSHSSAFFFLILSFIPKAEYVCWCKAKASSSSCGGNV
jgi:hypothetical protein